MLGSYVSAGYVSQPEEATRRFFDGLLDWAGVRRPVAVSGDPVEVRLLESGREHLAFVFNHAATPAATAVTLRVPLDGRVVEEIASGEAVEATADGGRLRVAGHDPAARRAGAADPLTRGQVLNCAWASLSTIQDLTPVRLRPCHSEWASSRRATRNPPAHRRRDCGFLQTRPVEVPRGTRPAQSRGFVFRLRNSMRQPSASRPKKPRGTATAISLVNAPLTQSESVRPRATIS